MNAKVCVCARPYAGATIPTPRSFNAYGPIVCCDICSIHAEFPKEQMQKYYKKKHLK